MQNLLIFVYIYCAFAVYHLIAESCFGEDVTTLPFGCSQIRVKPLLIRGGFDKTLIKSKLSSVRTVEAGVEVIGTDLVTFDLLPNITSIINTQGPAIIFSENQKLKRIEMMSLKKLEGKENDVFFDKDNFPVQAKKNDDAMDDFMFLQMIAKRSHGADCKSFVKIIKAQAPNDFSETKILWIILIVIAIISWILTVSHFSFRKFSAKKKSEKEVNQEKMATLKEEKAEIQKIE